MASAHPRFPTDEDELAGTLGGPLEPLLQEIGFMLAPHDGASRQRREDI